MLHACVHVIKDSELLLLFTGTFRVLCIIVQDGFIFQILNEVVHIHTSTTRCVFRISISK
jgi:hypothetical protein